MNKENVDKLIAALRSGKYEQTRTALRVGNRFCCLGVACDISGLGKWEDKRNGYKRWEYVIRDTDGNILDADATVLPTVVAQWLGVDAGAEFEMPYYDYVPYNEVEWASDNGGPVYDNRTSLAELNDGGFTFIQIADMLENASQFTWGSPPSSDDTTKE